ncbi:MAG: hypothetical protein C0596_16665 [Marinilabiliales bacterium]|nr:MAG: hypothetical protein C0596_16665 [Marinilabiliales bacterium]
MKSKLFVIKIIILILTGNNLYPQINLEWAYCFGEAYYESCWDMTTTSDGDFVLVGELFTSYGIWKIDGNGNTIWTKHIGGYSLDRAEHIIQTHDQGFIISGRSRSDEGDVSGHHGTDDFSDFWIVKLNSEGEIDWEKSYGGSDDDVSYCIEETLDGGYIAVGYAKSIDGDISQNYGNADYWVVKLNSEGNIEWEKTYGGIYDDFARSVICLSSGNFLVFGYSNQDFYAIMIDDTGQIIWQKTYGGTSLEQASAACMTNDNGFLLIGDTQSSNGDVTGHYGGQDVWIVKIDNEGNKIWANCYGGTNGENGYSIISTLDGNYMFVAHSASSDYDLTNNYGHYDLWVGKINSNGQLIWQNSYGGSDKDSGYAIHEINETSFVIAGTTYSNDIDVHNNNGNSDAWLIKLSSNTKVKNNNQKDIYIYPNPATNKIYLTNLNITFDRIVLFNSTGDKIFSEENYSKNWIDIEALQNGIYLLYLFKDNEIEVKRIVKV